MAKIRSFGAEVYINGIAVGGLTDISASGTDVAFIDSTSHDTAGGFRTFLSGLKDGGTLELTGKYNYANAGQAEWKAEEGVLHAFYIILADNSGFAFNAIVGGFKTSNPLDDAVEFTADARITGPVYPVFPTITITGITDPVDSDPLVLPFYIIENGRAKWFGDGFSLAWAAGDWEVAGADYQALKTSDALTPYALSSWTLMDGTGQPTLAGS